MSSTLNNYGIVLLDLGEFEAAEACLKESLEIDRQTGNLKDIAIVLDNLADLALAKEDGCGGARIYGGEPRYRPQDGRLQRRAAESLRHLAEVNVHEGHHEEACALYGQSLRIVLKLQDYLSVAKTLRPMASLALAESLPATAARLLGASDSLRQALGSPCRRRTAQNTRGR